MKKLITFKLEPYSEERLLSLCGNFDNHIRTIEKNLHVSIHFRANAFQISGDSSKSKTAQNILEYLYNETLYKEQINDDDVHVCINTIHSNQTDSKIPGTKIKCRNKSQQAFVEAVTNNTVTFAVGPAGTGKTFLAVATAINALESNLINKIILTRPVVEAGENLGYLPGDLSQKIDPYLRPLFDSLHTILGPTRLQTMMDQNIIEVAPLAYMRGRSLNNSFILLDEGQNTSIEQMKMFLTRMGFRSKAIITGDVSQIDIPTRVTSGLVDAIKRFDNISKEITIHHFTVKDVVRHPIVQTIISAYD
ncbi:MAG TPA: PhoH family protein [Gammaproteobacteria bacterium]|nr:PhoH family protein [Gammaproteobacteria bacterium]